MDAYNRFDLIFEDNAEEYLEKKEEKRKKANKAAAKERRRIEEKGECEGCGNKEYNRWVHNKEIYLCQDCFLHDLQCEAEIQVPMHRVEYMEGYDEYLNWDDLWENNE